MKHPRFLYDADPWMLGEDIPDADVFFAQIWQSAFVNEFSRPSGRAYRKLLNVQRGQHLWFYFGERDSYDAGEHIARRIIGDPQWATTINKHIVLWADRLRRFAETIPDDSLAALSNAALWRWYRKHDAVHTQYYQWCWIPVGADMFHDNLTNRVKRYLRQRTPEDNINEYLVILTQPRKKSLIQIEHEDFLKIAGVIYRHTKQRDIFRKLYRTFQEQLAALMGLKTHTPEYERVLEERVKGMKAQIPSSILRCIERHYRAYYYVKFMWIGKDGVYSFDHYLKELVKLIGSGVNPLMELARLGREFRRQQQVRQRLMKKLRIGPKWRKVFDEWGDFMVTKIYRRYAQIYAIYRMQPILREIARRIRLSDGDVRFMLKDEVRQALLQKKVNRAAIRSRRKLAVYYYEKGLEMVFTGARARALVKRVEKIHTHDVREVTGQVGCVGMAAGIVKLVFRPSDMSKMNIGDILVSIATDPDIVPAMKKAAAIVTEQGGMTSHAAIVARELGIPCVIGTKIAIKVFTDGDRVEVDATKGIVRKI